MLTMKHLWVFLIIPFFWACDTHDIKASGSSAGDTSDVVPLEEAELVLFDGSSLIGWHEFNKKGQQIKGWSILDSALVCLGSTKENGGGDLVSDGDYENMELSWEWKLDAGSNSGVLYHVIEEPQFNSPSETGPEYQLIDDAGYPEKLEGWQKTGADYAMQPAGPNKKLKLVGQWNTSKIIYNQGHVEHWLNGDKIVEFEAGSPEWNKHRSAGKWKDYPDYAKSKRGKIVLQNYGKKVYFRNIVIKEL
jgi:hypothetical protein